MGQCRTVLATVGQNAKQSQWRTGGSMAHRIGDSGAVASNASAFKLWGENRKSNVAWKLLLLQTTVGLLQATTRACDHWLIFFALPVV